MTSLTRGPLPAAVYWRRRLVVLSVALLLLLGAVRLLGGGGDPADAGRATTVAAEDVSSAPTAGPTEDPAGTVTEGPTGLPSADLTGGAVAEGGEGRRGRAGAGPAEPVLAEPEGRCDSADVAVTPEVSDAVAGRDVDVVLQLRTALDPACTWRVSPSTLTLKITSGSDGIWSTRECPRALPAQDVVIRNNVTTEVTVTWRDAARMDDDCARISEWALPGWYHATAAALGGEPSDVQFELAAPGGPSASDAGSTRPKRR